MKKTIFKKIAGREGQILVEVMLALSIVVAVFTGIIGLLSTTVSMTRVVSNQYVGTYLAAEGIEIVKNTIDMNYFAVPQRAFNTNLSDGIYEVDYTTDGVPDPLIGDLRKLEYDPITLRYGYQLSGPDVVETSYTRAIQIAARDLNSDSVDDALEVTVRVEWQAKGGTYSVTLGDVFTEWW